MTTGEAQQKAYEEERKLASKLFQLSCSSTTDEFKHFVAKEFKDDYSLIQEYKDGNKRTPLHFAAHSGNTEVCKMIVEQDGLLFSVSDKRQRWSRDAEGYTPVGLSILGGNEQVFEFFWKNDKFQKGVGENKCSLMTDEVTLVNLYNAAVAGSEMILRTLLTFREADEAKGTETKGSQLLTGCMEHGTVLHGAIFSQNQSCVELLLQYSECDVNQEDSEGITPLMVAIATGALPIVKTLLSSSTSGKDVPDQTRPASKVVDLLKETKNGSNILHTAVESGHLDILNYLLALLSGVNASPVDNLSEHDSDKFSVLMKRRNEKDLTPLETAVVHENKIVFQILFDHFTTLCGDQGENPIANLLPEDAEPTYEGCMVHIETQDKQRVEHEQSRVEEELQGAEAIKHDGNELFKTAIASSKNKARSKNSSSSKLTSHDLFERAKGKYSESIDRLDKYLGALKKIENRVYKLQNKQVLEKEVISKVQNQLSLVLNNLSFCRLKLGEIPSAVEAAKRAQELNEYNLKSYYRLGQAYEAGKDYADGAQAYWDGYSFVKKLKEQGSDEASKMTGNSIDLKKIQEEEKVLFDLFQEAVAKGKSQERKKRKTKEKEKQVQGDFDYVVPIEIPVNMATGEYKTLELKFDKEDKEAEVAGEFIRKNNLHPSLIERVAKHIFDVKRSEAED